MHTDSAFAGKMPDAYEQMLVPLLFEPFAVELSDRLAKYSPNTVLELAAGTGALTRELSARLPDVEITATDISAPMIDKASHVVRKPNVHFQVADASALPFDEASFDVVVAQFGVMFFSEKIAAYHQVHRVLREGGTFVFNTWNMLLRNPVFKVFCKAFKENSGGQPCFLERIAFAYCDDADIKNDLHAAGFGKVDVYTVHKTTKAHSAAAFLDAIASGSPFAADLEHLGRDRGAHVRESIFEALTAQFGEGEFDNELSALVIETKK